MPQEAVKITCSTEDLDAKLSKSMKLLGAHHDEYGRLLNAENKYIGGLTQARIKMGDYIDAQGRMRDANGNFLDGLTAAELKLRMFKDELGNVYNAEGELVRISEAAAKAQEELATAGQRGVQSLLSGAKGAAKMANNLSLMIGVLGGGNEGLTKLGQNVVIATQTFSQFALAMKTLPKFINGFKLLTVATEGQTAAQVILNAVSGNWVALIAGGLAAGTLAYKTLSSSTKEAKTETQKLTDEYERLTKALKDYNTYIQAGRIEQSGFLNPFERETIDIERANRQLEVYNKAYSILKEQQAEVFAGGPFGGGGDKKYDALQEAANNMSEKISNQQKEVATQINALMNKDLPGASEMEKLRERAAYYEKVISEGILEGDALANAQKALANNLKRQQEIVDKENEEKERAAKEAADREAAEAERKLAEAQRKLGDKFNSYADGSALFAEEERLNATIQQWRENFEAAGKTEAELNTAIANLKKEYDQKRLQEFLNANDLKVREDQKLTAEEEYTQTLEKIKEAEETYGLQATEAEKLRAQAAEDYAAALKRQEEDAEKERQNRLNELGITGLRESMKSPLQKMIEQQQKVAQAAEEGLISQQEAAKMQAKLAADYAEQNQQTSDTETAGINPEEYKRAATMTFGSNELYQAMTQRETGQERYQNGVTKTLNNMDRYTEENNTILQAIQNNLGDVMKAVGVV